MKFRFPRPTFRPPTPRVWLGLALIATSIGGTVAVIAENSGGTGMVLATRFIPAGSSLGPDDVVEASIIAPVDLVAMSREGVIGQRVAVDVAAGDLITRHSLDSTSAPRRVIAVPLGISPAGSLGPGARIELWFIASTDVAPPRLIAHDALVVQNRSGSFGEGEIVDVSIDARDEDALLAAMGADGLIVATEGSDVS